MNKEALSYAVKNVTVTLASLDSDIREPLFDYPEERYGKNRYGKRSRQAGQGLML